MEPELDGDKDRGLGNFGTFSTGLVNPRETTQHQLAGGHYSLSTLSTVPYVRLIGGSRTEKIFSWGEIVYVPDDVAVSIANASYHAGDIVINGGRDFSTLPQRVTVPVPLVVAPTSDDAVKSITGKYPVDTRRARRAFIALNLSTTSEQTTLAIFTIGKVEPSEGGHSHGTAPTIGLPPDLASIVGGVNMVGYINPIAIPAATAQGIFPIGNFAQAAPPTLPHALLDSGSFVAFVPTDFDSGSANAYYILEY